MLKNPDDIDAYLEAVNLWGQKIQMSSPERLHVGLGRGEPERVGAQVAAYMQEAKFDVEESADLLKRILVMLGLPLTAASVLVFYMVVMRWGTLAKGGGVWGTSATSALNPTPTTSAPTLG